MQPKKNSIIYGRVPESLKSDFKRSLAAIGITEAFFVRASAEALVVLVKEKKELSLPIRLLDVESKRASKQKP